MYPIISVLFRSFALCQTLHTSYAWTVYPSPERPSKKWLHKLWDIVAENARKTHDTGLLLFKIMQFSGLKRQMYDWKYRVFYLLGLYSNEQKYGLWGQGSKIPWDTCPPITWFDPMYSDTRFPGNLLSIYIHLLSTNCEEIHSCSWGCITQGLSHCCNHCRSNDPRFHASFCLREHGSGMKTGKFDRSGRRSKGSDSGLWYVRYVHRVSYNILKCVDADKRMGLCGPERTLSSSLRHDAIGFSMYKWHVWNMPR